MKLARHWRLFQIFSCFFLSFSTFPAPAWSSDRWGMVTASSQVGGNRRAGDWGREKEGDTVIVKAAFRLFFLPCFSPFWVILGSQPPISFPWTWKNPWALTCWARWSYNRKKYLDGKPQMEESEANTTTQKTKSTFPLLKRSNHLWALRNRSMPFT